MRWRSCHWEYWHYAFVYVDDIVFFANTSRDAPKALELFCMHTKLSVNSSQIKMMLVKNQKNDKPCIRYNNEPLKCVEWFKYLALEVPSNHRWNECATRYLEARKRAYYAFKNTCNHGDIKCWVLKKYLFDTWMTPVLLYGMEVWGGSIPKSTLKEFEDVQKHFLTHTQIIGWASIVINSRKSSILSSCHLLYTKKIQALRYK